MFTIRHHIIILLGLLIIIISFFAFTLHFTGEIVRTCFDTDGKDPYIKGTVTAEGNTIDDECIGNRIIEFYCDRSGRLHSVLGTCPEGCKDGACTREPKSAFGAIKESIGISTNQDKLNVNEPLGEVIESLTSDDLESLADGVVSTRSGSTRYAQYIRFKDTGFSSGKVVYGENDDDEVGDYLYFQKNKEIYEYELRFSNGLDSIIDDNHLEDLEGEHLQLLGRVYTIIGAFLKGSTVELRLLSGSFTDTLEEGESKTYVVGGRQFTVELMSLDDTENKAMFRINGKETKAMKRGDLFYTEDLPFGVEETYQSEAGEGSDKVKFSFGAEYLILKDKADDDSFSQGVAINGKTLSAGFVKIKGRQDGDKYGILDIKYRLKADADRGGDIYVAAGHALSEYLEDGDGIIGKWDIIYKGLVGKAKAAPASIIKFDPHSDNSYDLEFTNNQGDPYNIDFVVNDGGSLKIGRSSRTLHFIESSSSADFKIAQGDNVVLTHRNDRGGITNILQYNSIDTNNKQAHFNDESAGSKTMSYSGTEGTDAAGDVVVGGNSYKVYVGAGPDYKLAMDFTHDGVLNSGEANVVVYGGGILDLGSTSSPGGSFTIILKTEAKQFDNPSGDETISMTIQNTGSGVDINLPAQAGLSIETESGKIRALSNYGVEFLQHTNGADSMTINYPSKQQAIADVAVIFLATEEPEEPQILQETRIDEEEALPNEQVQQEQPQAEEPAVEQPTEIDSKKLIRRPIEQRPSVIYLLLRAIARFFS